VFSTLEIRRHSRLADLLGDRIFAADRPVILTVAHWPAGVSMGNWLQAIRHRCKLAGVPLAVVSTHAQLTARARALSVPVFDSVDQAARYLEGARLAPTEFAGPQRLGKPDGAAASPPAAPMPRYGSWLSLTASAVLVLAGVAAVFGFAVLVAPAATVTVHPAVGHVDITVPMTASLAVDQPDNDMGLVPARFVSATQELRRTGPTSARKLLPTEKATGVLLAVNQTPDPITVPEGTVVQTGTGQATRFVTTEEVTVPANSQYQQPVPIEAVEPGKIGNVAANSITHIAGPFAFQLWITNPRPTTGGASELLPVVSQADRDRLQAELLAEASASAAQSLATELTDSEWLPPVGLDVELQWTSTDFFFGEETEELTMTMMVDLSGIVVDTHDMVEYVMAQVARHTPSGGLLLPTSLDLSLQPDPVWTGAELNFAVAAAVDYVPEIAKSQVRRAVVGLSREEALAQLAVWSPAGPPQIELFPPTHEVLPRLAPRIRVRTHVPT